MTVLLNQKIQTDLARQSNVWYSLSRTLENGVRVFHLKQDIKNSIRNTRILLKHIKHSYVG